MWAADRDRTGELGWAAHSGFTGPLLASGFAESRPGIGWLQAHRRSQRENLRSISREPGLPWKPTLGNSFDVRKIVPDNNKHKWRMV